MLVKVTSVVATFLFISSVAAVAVPAAKPEPSPVEIVVEGETLIEFATIQCGNEKHGLKPICPHLNKTEDHGCIRCRSLDALLQTTVPNE